MSGGQTVSDVMTAKPITLPTTASAVDAARLMKEQNIGDVIIVEGERLYGIVTDRDLAVRVIGEGRDPGATRLADICSADLQTVGPNAPIDEAVRMMREAALRRLPVSQNSEVVGVVSIGDLALERDPDSALADISAAPPNQ